MTVWFADSGGLGADPRIYDDIADIQRTQLLHAQAGVEQQRNDGLI